MYVHVYDSMWNLNGDWVVSLIPRLLPLTESLASVPGSLLKNGGGGGGGGGDRTLLPPLFL